MKHLPLTFLCLLEAHANRNSNRLKSILILFCLFLTGCETLSWVQVNPPAGTHLMTVSTNMPDEHTILTTAKVALTERFGYDRVFIRHYYPFNF
jgi:hypothetical protein